ncbi:MAG: rhodanese-like domain-containing protein [Planctomycetota bacterium]
MSSPDPAAIEIGVEDVKSLLDRDAEFTLLDVRTPEEHGIASIAGATLLPMSDLAERIGELEVDRARHLVVHCHHGGRSLQVTLALRNAGFSNVQNMAGGIDAWSQEIDSSVPRY